MIVSACSLAQYIFVLPSNAWTLAVMTKFVTHEGLKLKSACMCWIAMKETDMYWYFIFPNVCVMRVVESPHLRMMIVPILQN